MQAERQRVILKSNNYVPNNKPKQSQTVSESDKCRQRSSIQLGIFHDVSKDQTGRGPCTLPRETRKGSL